MLIDNPIKTRKGDITLKDYFGNTVTREDLEKMYEEYYDEHGWDKETGMPTRVKLKELDLASMPKLYPHRKRSG